MPESFATTRLDLRALTVDDTDLLVGLHADAEVMAYITGRALSADESRVDLARSLGTRWLAFERPAGSFVGWVSAVPRPDHPDDVELGWRLHRSAWGHGYATEAAGALVERLFAEGFRRVFAQTMAVNSRSRGVMERIGLQYARTVHLHFDDPLPGTEHGEVEYELTVEEFHRLGSGR